MLNQTAKLIAPFTPFVTEDMWQNLNNTTTQSVHWQEWTTHKKQLTAQDKKVLKQMKQVRDYATAGLRLRSEVRIRVRQPLYTLFVPERLDNHLADILKREVNVHSVVTDKKGLQAKWTKDKDTEVELNTLIDSELEKQGVIRDIVRRIQDARKELRLKPSDTLNLIHYNPTESSNIRFTDQDEEYIAQQVRAQAFVQGQLNATNQQYVKIETDVMEIVVYKS